jgi:hypothetical protein
MFFLCPVKVVAKIVLFTESATLLLFFLSCHKKIILHVTGGYIPTGCRGGRALAVIKKTGALKN